MLYLNIIYCPFQLFTYHPTKCFLDFFRKERKMRFSQLKKGQKISSVIAFLIMTGLTTWSVLLAVFENPVVRENMKARVVVSLVFLVVTAGFGVVGVGMLFRHHLNIERVTGKQPGNGFAWFCFIVAVVLLNQLVGALLGREGVCWYSD